MYVDEESEETKIPPRNEWPEFSIEKLIETKNKVFNKFCLLKHTDQSKAFYNNAFEYLDYLLQEKMNSNQ